MKIDKAVNAAQNAIDELDGVEVTEENVVDINAQIANAKGLVANAEEMDENVVFDTYPLEQAEAAALPVAKTVARDTLDEHMVGLNPDEEGKYSEENRKALDEIIIPARTNLEEAETTDEVTNLLADALEALDNVVTNAEIEAGEDALAEAKVDARNMLDEHMVGLNPDEEGKYSEENRKALDEIIIPARTNLEEAEDTDAVDLILAEALEALDNVKTNADKESEQTAVDAEALKFTSGSVTVDVDATELTLPELADGYTATIASSTDEDIIATGENNVAPPESAATVVVEFTVTKDGTDFTAKSEKVIVEVPQSSDAALTEAKKDALTDLNAHFALEDFNNYTDRSEEGNRTELDKVLIDARDAIEEATDTDELTSIVETAKEGMDAVKTDTEINDELDGEITNVAMRESNKVTNAGTLNGYSVNLALTEGQTFEDAKVEVKLYAGEDLLQTNTLSKESTINEITVPFDVSGDYDYDEYWTVELGTIREDKDFTPNKVEYKITLGNGKVLEVTETDLPISK